MSGSRSLCLRTWPALGLAALVAVLLGACGSESAQTAPHTSASIATTSATNFTATVPKAGTGQTRPSKVPPTQKAPGPGETVTSPHVTQPPAPVHRSSRPNIVFVLTDDLSLDLIKYMPTVSRLERQGLTFRNYFVSDSLCCPSRASIFTGNFPHDTKVFTNAEQGGGMKAFWRNDDERKVFNLALYKSGYRTAFMGKYLNGYLEQGNSPVPATYIPAGWSNWDTAGWGYPEYNYTLNQDGKLHRYGNKPRDYLTDVISRLGVKFIDRAAKGTRPFFLELATFTPHYPYVPAKRDAHRFAGIKAPEPPNFNRLPTDPPSWLQGHKPLSPTKLRRINHAFRRRVQDVQSIDRMMHRVEDAVARDGLGRNTYFVFSSDNGYHTGEYRLLPGKLTAFDTDIHVPLIVAGPGITPGSSTTGMAENVDLAKTFAGWGGLEFPSDGHSLIPLLQGGPAPTGWRDVALVEHHGPTFSADDPDRQNFDSGNPTTYEAIRTKDFLYVEYKNGQREFYDLRNDPFELDNEVNRLPAEGLRRLHAAMERLRNCHTGPTCWAAEHLPARFVSEVTHDSA